MTEYTKNWKKYEEYCIDYHRNKYNHITWWWNNIPEEELYKSKVITSTQKLRMMRKNNKNLQEYGLDGLALDENNNYHGLQMKYYNPKTYLTANKLGSYTMVINKLYLVNNNSNGYLYYSCRLEIIFKELMDEMDYHNYERLLMDTKTKEEIINYDETTFTPYPCQLDAIDALVNYEWNDDLGIISMPCGIGKTFVLAKYIQNFIHDKIIIICPLKIQVTQMYNRIKPFINNHYSTLIIDSDGDGTTDKIIIDDFINTNDKFIIFITFKSANDIFEFNDDYFVVIDEAHNLINNDLLDKLNNALLLTATPPLKLLEEFNVDIIYEYTMGNAIKDGYICDYLIHLPIIDFETNEIRTIIPRDLEYNNIDLASKCLFLLSGMLEKGSKKCIVYCSSIQECKDFNDEFKLICKGYHYLKCKTYSISCENNYEERNKLLKKFQKEYDGIKIISSVRILDEGVNIVKCDSIFLTSLKDTSSEIRTVQRMCRSNRLDKENPNKVSNCFVWCDDSNSLVNSLSYLRNADSNFIEKINVINSNYDDKNNDNETKLKLENKEHTKLNVKTKCMSYEEVFSEKLKMVSEFIDDNNHRPKQNSKDKYEKYLCYWLQDRIKQYNRNVMNDIIKKEFKEFLDKYHKYFKSNEEIWNEKKELLFEYCNTYNQIPSGRKLIFKNLNIIEWYGGQKKKINSKDDEVYKLLSENKIVKNALDRYIFDINNNFTSYFYDKKKFFIEYIEIFNKVPSSKVKYKNHKIGQWYSSQKERIHDKNNEVYKLLSVNKLVKDNLDKYLINKEKNKNKIKFTFNQWKDILFEYCNKFNRTPPQRNDYNNIKIGKWFHSVKMKLVDKNNDKYRLLSVNIIVKKELDRYLKYKNNKTFINI